MPRSAQPDARDVVVLVVDDDPVIRNVLGISLAAHDYHVLPAENGHDALDIAGRQHPDVVLLDLGLPDLDGLEVCRQLRLITHCPIVIISAERDEGRLVQALDLGADDYVNKPFSMPTLLARLRVAVRHSVALSAIVEHDLIEVGTLRIDVPAYQAAAAAHVLDLKPREFKLLTLLARNAGRLVTYRSIVQQLWSGDRHIVDMQAVRVSISLLRRQLAAVDGAPQVLTEPHVGYRLVTPATASSSRALTLS